MNENRVTQIRIGEAPIISEHRLTWRMYHPVLVWAATKQEAIAEALRTQPKHIPAGTELYYGMVAGMPVGKAS